MDKNDLLKHIAETGYNVGFGAKLHFATYDIVDKTPGLIGFISTAVGIFSLFIKSFIKSHLKGIPYLTNLSFSLVSSLSKYDQVQNV